MIFSTSCSASLSWWRFNLAMASSWGESLVLVVVLLLQGAGLLLQAAKASDPVHTKVIIIGAGISGRDNCVTDNLSTVLGGVTYGSPALRSPCSLKFATWFNHCLPFLQVSANSGKSQSLKVLGNGTFR